MRYWLLKSEPNVFSWQDQVLRGHSGEPWTGVRNHSAKLNLMAMKAGDRAFFYHSNEGKEIVGVAKVVREAYPDPTSTEDWSVVELSPQKALKWPVTLATLKAHPTLKDMALLRRSRISVVPVTEAEFLGVLKLSESAPVVAAAPKPVKAEKPKSPAKAKASAAPKPKKK